MQKGDFVRIAYIGRLESGEIFDLTDAEIAKKEKTKAIESSDYAKAFVAAIIEGILREAELSIQ